LLRKSAADVAGDSGDRATPVPRKVSQGHDADRVAGPEARCGSVEVLRSAKMTLKRASLLAIWRWHVEVLASLRT
jgi:hypothetical protein